MKYLKAVVAGALLLAAGASGWAGAAQPGTSTILFVADHRSSAQAGARQGIDELNVLGQFTNQRYRLQLAEPGVADQGAATQSIAIIAAVAPPALEDLVERYPDHAVLNVTERGNALREHCGTNLLHVIPSAAMAKDAEAQWRRKHPDSDAKAQAWQANFEKYAGRDLNKRFRKGQGRPMDDEAWAGWAAVKVIGDAVLRSGATEPAQVLDYLHTRLQFDGQKGMPLSFRDNGQLRQPLLLVQNGKVVGEAPVGGVVDVEDLDSLGASVCRTKR